MSQALVVRGNAPPRSHEVWFHFTKEPRYFAAVDEIREPHTRVWEAPGGVSRASERNDVESLALASPHPLGKLPGSVWNLTYWECVDRIERGWAPSGICVECGEGRRPVVEKVVRRTDRPNNARHSHFETNRSNQRLAQGQGYSGAGMSVMGATEATITGYVCACRRGRTRGLMGPRSSRELQREPADTEPSAPTTPPLILLNPPEEMMPPLVETP